MSRLRRQRRRIPIRGNYEDRGRYFHCWNCGFVCDSQRDRTSDESGVRVVTADVILIEDGDKLAAEDGSLGIGLEPDTTATPTYTPKVILGCPFCGTGRYSG